MQFIYLDQNKWIDLAKAEAGRSDGKRFVAVLSAARDAVKSGRAIFPISATHIKETAYAPKLDQREKLAKLLTELSQGVVIRTPRPMVEHGLRRELRRTFSKPLLDQELSLFGRGIEDAFGFNIADKMADRSSELVERLRDRIDRPDAWIDLLTNDNEETRHTAVEHLKTISTRFADGRQDDRELLNYSSRDEVRRAFAARVTIHFRDALDQSLAEMGKCIEDWGKLGPKGLVEFWHRIPCVRVLLELEECLHFDKSKTWKPNDLHDLEFLSLAIPHCDVVVAEKYWIHHAKQRKLHIEFDTALLTDLIELEDLLRA